MSPKKHTETYTFGTGRRESHDASRYYNRSLFSVDVDKHTRPALPHPDTIDNVFNTDARDMSEIADNSVALMITSPPYHVGKALRSSTPVLTPTGWVKIGELAPGDQVMSQEGPTAVLAVYPQGPRQLYRVTFNDGSWVDADGDHLWTCQTFTQRDKRNGRTDEWVTLTTKEILDRWGSEPTGPYAITIPMIGSVDLHSDETLPIAPYDLGVILGDGCITPGGYVRVVSGDPEIFDLMESECGEARGPEGIERSVPGLAPIMRSLGLVAEGDGPVRDRQGLHAWEKFVPAAFLWSDADTRLSVLQGLMDADGSCAQQQGSCEYTTTSPCLADDVVFLVRSLGGTATITRRTTSYQRGTGRESFRVRIHMSVCPFRLARKADVWHRFADRRVNTRNRVLRSIEVVDLDDATCIKVADPSSLFVTKDFIVTHNTYDTDEGFPEYLQMMTDVIAETHRVLEPGGRMCINVAGLGRKPYVPLPDLIGQIARDIGFLPRGEILWVKGKGMSGSCAWGSWMSPTNPSLRDLHEYILVFSKGRFERALKPTERRELELPWEATIAKEDFMAWTLSVWEMGTESARKVGHPAPFPVELPHRLIQLYSFAGDLILDPFMGSGTTAVAAIQDGRHFVGYENDRQHGYFTQLAGRLAAELARKDQT